MRAAKLYAASHSDDPDLGELDEAMRRSRESHLEWGRATLGWAVYMFMKPARGARLCRRLDPSALPD